MRRALVVCVVLSALVAGACSSGGSGSGATATTTSSLPAEPEPTTTTVPQSPAMSAFVQEALAICQATTGSLPAPADNSPATLLTYLDQTFTLAQSQLDQLLALPLPPEEGDAVEANFLGPRQVTMSNALAARPTMEQAASQGRQQLEESFMLVEDAYTDANLDWVGANGLAGCG